MLRLVTPATDIPVALADVVKHLRVDTNDDDDLIETLIYSATEECEQITSRALMTQTWELALSAFPGAHIPLRRFWDYGRGQMWRQESQSIDIQRVPVQSVTSLTYVDPTGATITANPSIYLFEQTSDFGHARVMPAYGTEWPETRDDATTVKVQFVAGYASADLVPAPLKAWIKMRCGALYENRQAWTQGAVIERNDHVDSLLDRYRTFAQPKRRWQWR